MGAAVVWAGIGAALMWLALRSIDDENAPPQVTASERADTANRVPTAATARTAEAPPAQAPVPAAEGRAGERSEGNDPPRPAASNPIVAENPPSNSQGTTTDLPNRRGEPAERAPASTLLDVPRISCDFGAGNNTGLRFGEVLTVGGGAQWQGGLLDYELGGSEPGTALLKASPSVTGTPSGETKVQVATEGSRIFLSGFQEDRAFVVVTIFDELDNLGRHIAVMSRHEGTFSFASQFLGTCE